VTLLYKKRNRRDLGNYRINVNSILSRLFAKNIHNKGRKTQITLLTKIKMFSVQYFSRRCIDGLFIILGFVYNPREGFYNSTGFNWKENSKGMGNAYDLYLKKAYNSIEIEKFDRTQKSNVTLQEYNIDNHLIRIIKELYMDNRTHIKVDYLKKVDYLNLNAFRKPYNGYGLYSLLFNIYLEKVLKELRKSYNGMGIPIDEFYLYTLSFVDDHVLS